MIDEADPDWFAESIASSECPVNQCKITLSGALFKYFLIQFFHDLSAS